MPDPESAATAALLAAPVGSGHLLQILIDDEAAFTELASSTRLSEPLLEQLVFAATNGALRDPEQVIIRRVRLLLGQAAITAEQLGLVASRVFLGCDGAALPTLAPALLAHPACTDRVVMTLLDLPYSPAALARVLTRIQAVAPGDWWAKRCVDAFAAVAAADHPVAGALALLAHPEGSDEVDPVVRALVERELDRLRRAAADAGVAPGTLTRALVGLTRGWPGTRAELLATAVAVCTG